MAMTIWLKMPIRSKPGFALAYRTGVNKGPGFWFALFLSLLSSKTTIIPETYVFRLHPHSLTSPPSTPGLLPALASPWRTIHETFRVDFVLGITSTRSRPCPTSRSAKRSFWRPMAASAPSSCGPAEAPLSARFWHRRVGESDGSGLDCYSIKGHVFSRKVTYAKWGPSAIEVTGA